jgi:hypothetical protein
MPVHRRGRMLASGLAALALTVTVTGCGATDTADTDPTGAGPSPGTRSDIPDPVESQTAERSPSAGSPATKTPSMEEPASPAQVATQEAAVRGIRGGLLPADQLPGFNDEFAWRERSTRMREGRRPFGTCHKFAMTSIGATRVTVRRYVPAAKSPGSTASNLVAEFADDMTARRAYEVLKSWREQCADRLKTHPSSDVGALKQIPVDGHGAVGNWYLLVYGPADRPDSSSFDAQGLTRVGSTISVVQMSLEGQDYDYPSGGEPMVGAVRKAATRIG